MLKPVIWNFELSFKSPLSVDYSIKPPRCPYLLHFDPLSPNYISFNRWFYDFFSTHANKRFNQFFHRYFFICLSIPSLCTTYNYQLTDWNYHVDSWQLIYQISTQMYLLYVGIKKKCCWSPLIFFLSWTTVCVPQPNPVVNVFPVYHLGLLFKSLLVNYSIKHSAIFDSDAISSLAQFNCFCNSPNGFFSTSLSSCQISEPHLSFVGPAIDASCLIFII